MLTVFTNNFTSTLAEMLDCRALPDFDLDSISSLSHLYLSAWLCCKECSPVARHFRKSSLAPTSIDGLVVAAPQRLQVRLPAFVTQPREQESKGGVYPVVKIR